MNYTRDYGWYYINANDKAPAWTATRYLYNFLTRKSLDQGPVGQELGVSSMEPGDIIQLAFQDSGYFTHSLFKAYLKQGWDKYRFKSTKEQEHHSL